MKMDNWELKEKQIKMGQAMNMANAYLLAREESKSLSIEQYKKELLDKTQVFLMFIESTQESYKNALQVSSVTAANKTITKPAYVL